MTEGSVCLRPRGSSFMWLTFQGAAGSPSGVGARPSPGEAGPPPGQGWLQGQGHVVGESLPHRHIQSCIHARLPVKLGGRDSAPPPLCGDPGDVDLTGRCREGRP